MSPVALALPCDGCAHVVVCAIAPILRDRLAPFRAPELVSAPAGVTVDARIDVSCEYFLATAPTATDAVERSRPLIESLPHNRPSAPLTVERLRETGHAPADDAPLTCDLCGRSFARRNHLTMHRRSHTGGGDEATKASLAREAASVRQVADRIRERERDRQPAQNEQTGETFEERRARIARERGNANQQARRGVQP